MRPLHLQISSGTQVANHLSGITCARSHFFQVQSDIRISNSFRGSQYNQAHEVTFALAQIPDAECHSKAEARLAGIKKTIVQLQLGFIPLDETEFNLEGAKCCDLAVRRLKTVDPVTNGWLTRGASVNYYQSNLRALERGADITRIFVMSHEELVEPDSQKILLAQYRDGIEVRIAFREELPAAITIYGGNVGYDGF